MDREVREILASHSERAPAHLDLTDRDHLAALRAMAESLEVAFPSVERLSRADEVASADATVPIPVRVALKLAASRASFRGIESPVHVSVLFAVYKEHRRIRTVEEDPAGEDFLREKLRQLRWLFDDAPHHSWDLAVVDDGCPEGSGALAQEILDDFAGEDEEVRVLFLEDAIRERLPIVGDLTSTDQSRKGGSIRLGLWHATQTPRGPGHVALFTDADLSTHLGQIGLLVGPLQRPECRVSVGSRREPASVVVKAGARDARGKLFIYLWKRLIPELRGIIDTQCGFKAFDAESLSAWILDTHDSGFSFDVELLLRSQLEHPGSVARVPIAWIDSVEASTTAELEPYVSMLQSIARLRRDGLRPALGGDPFARLIERLDDASFRTLVANVPSGIASREPHEFEDYSGTSPEELSDAAGIRA